MTSSSTTLFNDFSPEGIRQMVESTVSSPRARHQLIVYITQLQMAAYGHSSKTASSVPHQQSDTLLLRRENEVLRARLSKFEAQSSSFNCNNHGSSKLSSFSSSASMSPSQNHHSVPSGHPFYGNHPTHDSAVDSDDLDSTASTHSSSSTMGTERTATMIEQAQSVVPTKYFDRKRRLLAAEPLSDQLSSMMIPKKTSPHKKACLDDIVDSLSQKAQAEQEVDDEAAAEEEEEIHAVETEAKEEIAEEDDEAVIVACRNTKNHSTPPSSTTERDDDDEDIDIEDIKLNDNDH
jgi:hypothetical protein